MNEYVLTLEREKYTYSQMYIPDIEYLGEH